MDYLDWVTTHCDVGNVTEKNIEIKCMFHEDTHASLSIERATGRWKCFGCDAKGTLKKIAKKLGIDLPAELKQFESVTSALPQTYVHAVKKAHERLLNVEDAIRERLIKEWGISEAHMKKLKLGWDEERLWIPIYYSDQLVNIRKYKFDADRAKVVSVKGAKTIYIYPMSVITKNNDIIIVEGEKDAIVGLAHGLPCVTFTGGANTVPTKKQLMHLLHKDIAICYDCDSAGKAGSKKVVNALKRIADRITTIELPASELGKGGDLTDFFRTGHSQTEFSELRRTAKQRWPVPRITKEVDGEVYNIGLYNSRKSVWFGKRMKIRARCIGKTLQPFSVPYKGKIDCMNRGAKEMCAMCTLSNQDEDEQLDATIDDLETNEILSLIKCSTLEQKRNLSGIFGLACQDWEWVTVENLNVEQLILTQDPLQEDENFEEAPVYHEGYFIGSLLMDENLTYIFVGRAIANPKNQQLTHMFSEATTPQGFLQGTPTDDDWTDLKMFQVNGA